MNICQEKRIVENGVESVTHCLTSGVDLWWELVGHLGPGCVHYVLADEDCPDG